MIELNSNLRARIAATTFNLLLGNSATAVDGKQVLLGAGTDGQGFAYNVTVTIEQVGDQAVASAAVPSLSEMIQSFIEQVDFYTTKQDSHTQLARVNGVPHFVTFEFAVYDDPTHEAPEYDGPGPTISLSGEDARAFIEAILNPSGPSPAAIEAAKRYKEKMGLE